MPLSGMRLLKTELSDEARANALPAAALSFAAGNAAAAAGGATFLPLLWALLISCAAACFLAYRRALLKTAYALVLILFFLTGFIHAHPFLGPPASPRHIANLITARQQAAISGVIIRAPAFDGIKGTILISARELQPPGAENLLAASGLVRLAMPFAPPADLKAGDMLLARATLAPIEGFGIPGAFSYRNYLHYQGIWITGWLKSPAQLAKVHVLDPESFFAKVRFLPERIRQKTAHFLDQSVPQETAGLYKAILIGDRSGISQATLENFKAAGCMHLLAISGLHMGLLALLCTGTAMFVFNRFPRLLLRYPVKKIALVLTLLPLAGYALVSGFHAPVMRALVMIFIFMLAILFDRQWSIGSSIAIAALLIMILQPTAIFTVSFQLSFAAVIAIAAVTPRLLPRLRGPETPLRQGPFPFGLTGWLLSGLTVSAVALIGTAPLLLYYFNRIAPLSPLATLLVSPFLCFWSLPLGLIGLLFLPVLPGLTRVILHIGGWGITAADHVTDFFASLPFASLWFSTPTPAEMISYIALLVGFAAWHRHLLAKALFTAALLASIFLPVLHAAGQKLSTVTTVSFLDVGQGNATVLELPHGATILIDGGGPASERFNVGEQLIAPFLWKRGIDRLDAVVVNHAHGDHYNGLFFVLKRFRPRVLWINGRDAPAGGYTALLDLAGRLGIPVRVPGAGTVLYEQDGARLQGLSALHLPGQGLAAGHRQNASQNNRSLVLRLDSGKVSFLFPGDVDRETEQRLIREKRDLDVDILLSPHHGSRTSNGLPFLASTSPHYLVVSAGRHLEGTFPAPDLRGKCRALGIAFMNTADQGTISFSIEDGRLSTRTFGNGR